MGRWNCKIKSKQQLLKLQNKFGTDEKIGLQFAISRQAVHQARKRFGIPSAFYDRMMDKHMHIMHDYEWIESSVKELARKHRISLSHCYRILKKRK